MSVAGCLAHGNYLSSGTGIGSKMLGIIFGPIGGPCLAGVSDIPDGTDDVWNSPAGSVRT